MTQGIFKSSDGAVFVQSRGARTRARFLGCVDVDALTAAGGALDTLIRCFNPDGSGGWVTLDATVSPPDPVTTTITTLIEGSANSLELAQSGVANIFIHQREGGRSDNFQNFTRSWVLGSAYIGERSVNDVAMREEDNPSTMGFGISALPPLYSVFQKTTGRQSISAAEAVNGIHFCGVGFEKDQVGFAVTDALTGSPSDKADVLYTRDGGATWTATGTQPFSAAENIGAVTCFPIGRRSTRVVVARGTTDAGNPMEIAYSDDWGSTWQVVSVGSVNGQFAPGPNSLFALDTYNMWLVVGNGYIYYSDDAGLTWSTQDAGVATTNALWGIHFLNDRIGYAVGAADTILKTEDGGLSWTATLDNTGVSAVIRTVAVLSSDVVWVGTAAGQMWYTDDGGETWTEKAFTGSGAGSVQSIEFVNGSDLFGYMLHQTAGPVGTVWFTLDGGYSWDSITTFTNSGLNDISVTDVNTAFFTGELQGGTGVIGKVFAKP